MQGFLSFLHEQDVENDYQIVLEYVAENFDYEDEEELEELLQSLDEDDIAYIIDEASKFSTTKNLNYTPSGNQKGASEPTPAPKVTVSRPRTPAKKVKTQSSGESERKPGQAPRGDKPSASKPEQPPAQEPERPKAAKPQQRRIQKPADIAAAKKEEPKKETPSASNSSDKPKRKIFRSTISKAGVVSSGKKTSERTSPEAKARAKKVKRYLKKGTSAKKVQQYVNRERKRLGKEAKAKEAAAKKQERAQRPPKAQTSGSEAQPKKEPAAPKKPKTQTQTSPQVKAQTPKPPKSEKPSPEATRRMHQEPEERGAEGDKAKAERRKKLQTSINDRLFNANALKKKRGKFTSSAKKAGTVRGGGVKKSGDSVEASSRERIKSYVSSKKEKPKSTKTSTGFGPSRTAPKIDKPKASSAKPKKSLKDFIKGGISKAKSKVKKTARGALLKLARKLKEDYETCEFLTNMLIFEGYAENLDDAILIIEELGIESFQEILSE